MVELNTSLGNGALMDKLGIEWIETSPERVVARIPVEGNTQPVGFLHGGASACLAETIASVGSWLNDTTKLTFGIEIKVNHLKSVREGFITGVGLPLQLGRNVQVWEIRMTDDQERLVAFSTCTIAIKDAN
ncbi:MAG: hotdog fold thioesterase [Actinomycetota bacterium]